MSSAKTHILAQLRREILPLQGYKSIANHRAFNGGLGPIKYAFPNASFPLGAIHEFFCSGFEDASATSGFIAGILSSLMNTAGVAVYISSSRSIFPAALYSFGIEPDRIIFIDTEEKDRLWAMEEALKCEGLSAAICEMQDISFTASRRLQLAVEQSRVTGFIIRQNLKSLSTACVTRWRIKSLASTQVNGLPGVGFPRWDVELLKVRNGKPGRWQLEWRDGRFQHQYKLVSVARVHQRKAV